MEYIRPFLYDKVVLNDIFIIILNIISLFGEIATSQPPSITHWETKLLIIIVYEPGHLELLYQWIKNGLPHPTLSSTVLLKPWCILSRLFNSKPPWASWYVGGSTQQNGLQLRVQGVVEWWSKSECVKFNWQSVEFTHSTPELSV